jgi:hypothetical protein
LRGTVSDVISSVPSSTVSEKVDLLLYMDGIGADPTMDHGDTYCVDFQRDHRKNPGLLPSGSSNMNLGGIESMRFPIERPPRMASILHSNTVVQLPVNPIVTSNNHGKNEDTAQYGHYRGEATFIEGLIFAHIHHRVEGPFCVAGRRLCGNTTKGDSNLYATSQ